MQYKTYAKVDASKTTLGEALNYAVYLTDRFYLLKYRDGPLMFGSASPYEEKVLNYLKKNADYNKINELFGIMAVVDFWRSGRYSTGGRIHLYMGGVGPIFEALDSDAVIVDPVDYEQKDLIIRKIYSGLSDSLPPNAGNIHVHPHLCNLSVVNTKTVREELIADHGTQNSIGAKAPLQYHIMRVKNGVPFWDRTTVDSDIKNVFSLRR